MKKSNFIGIDGIEFEYQIPGVARNVNMEKKTLFNQFGKAYASIMITYGVLNLQINGPLAIRENNIYPRSKTDMVNIDSLKISIIADIEALLREQSILCNVGQSKLKRIECGITRRVAPGCTCSHVLNLINISFYKTTNVVYQRASRDFRYIKENETVVVPKITRRNYYTIKAYDKETEQLKKGNKYVEKGLLRIEVILLNRTIKKIFSKNPTLDEMFCKQSFVKVIEEYKRLFVEVLVGEYISKCRLEVTQRIFESLTETDNIIETMLKHKELIVDREVLRDAICKWQLFKGKTEVRAKRNADKVLCETKKFNLPANVFKTIAAFEDICW